MEEKVFFEHDGVQVTNARFKVDAQTYAIRNITSTMVWTRPQRWVLAGFFLLGAVGVLFTGKAVGAGVVSFIIAAALLWFGRPMHYVKLSTSAGEAKALASRQRDYVLQVVNALNEAMVSQHK